MCGSIQGIWGLGILSHVPRVFSWTFLGVVILAAEAPRCSWKRALKRCWSTWQNRRRIVWWNCLSSIGYSRSLWTFLKLMLSSFRCYSMLLRPCVFLHMLAVSGPALRDSVYTMLLLEHWPSLCLLPISHGHWTSYSSVFLPSVGGWCIHLDGNLEIPKET